METLSRTIPVTRPYKLPFESNKWGGAYFDGLTSNIFIPKQFVLSNLSIMLMVNSVLQNDDKFFFSTGNYSYNPTSKGWHMSQRAPSLGNSFLVRNTFPNSATVVDDLTYIYNKVNNFAITIDGATCNQYQNGILTLTSNLTAISDSPQLTTRIGCNTSSARFWNGIVYDVIVIAQTLTQPQIQDIMYGRILPTQFDCRLWHDYRLGHARDLSGNGNHGTLNGNVRFV